MPDHARTFAECPGLILQQLYEAEDRLRETVAMARERLMYCQQVLDQLATARSSSDLQQLPALSSVCRDARPLVRHCSCQDMVVRAPTIVAPAGILTPRETEILRLIAAGLSNRQITDRLFISPRTVERHIANIYLKLDVHSKAEAMAHVRRFDFQPAI